MAFLWSTKILLKNMPQIVSVLLAGGKGSRLWPVSRESRPKPFIKFLDEETLIHKAYERTKLLSSEVLTVTNQDYYFMARDEQDSAGIKGRFLLEPYSRNTAPAIALAAKMVGLAHGLSTTMFVLTADHLIGNQDAFKKSVLDASTLAELGYLVTFGVTPQTPETGFGYIQMGEPLKSAYKVARFVEKPDFKTAESYVDSKQYLWNSGMFCFKAGVFLEELKKTSPIVSSMVETCWQGTLPNLNIDKTEIPADLFRDVPDISVDYAVMEKSENVVVVPCDFDWNDVGSWSAIRELVPPDTNENRVQGEAILIDTARTYVHSDGRMIAALGVKDLVIVDTPDALLVSHRDRTQDVQKVVGQLQTRNHCAVKEHSSVARPWGTYTVLGEGPGFKIKRIEVRAGASLSLQVHHHRSEHWVVVSGTARIINGDQEIQIQTNQSTYIPVGQKHRLENPGDIPCVMIEIQCGSYLGEDDIVRFDDKYGR